jgi:hypothetical protein
MSAAADFDSSDEYQKLILKWTAAGHEVIHERGTFRHKDYKKELPPETVVKLDGAPLLSSHGKTVEAGELLPERTDLALDMDGNILPEHEFVKRYKNYLNWFNYVEGSDPGAEPIPDRIEYVMQVPDKFSESGGFVEAGWDARKPPEEEATHKYDPVKDEMVEMVRGQGEALGTAMEAVQKLLEERPAKRGPGRPRKEEA